MGEFFRVLTDKVDIFVDGFSGSPSRLFLLAAVGSLVLGTLLGAMRGLAGAGAARVRHHAT